MEKSNIDFNEKKGFICDMDGVIYHGEIRYCQACQNLFSGCMMKRKNTCFSQIIVDIHLGS